MKNKFDNTLERSPIDLEHVSNSLKSLNHALDEASIVAITNADGIITHVNDKFCLISKYSRAELLGKNHRILKSGHHPPDFYKNMWETISSGGVWRGVVKNKAKDDSFYWVKTTVVPVLEDGVITQYISIRTDITEQIELNNKLNNTLNELKKTNEFVKKQSKTLIRQERTSAIGELSARLTHDIRNPLNIIQTQLEIFKITNKNQTQKDVQRFFIMEKAIHRITHQIDHVMDFIKLKPLEFETTNLRKLLNDINQSIIRADKIEINMLMQDVFLKCDPIQLEVVFENILLNSIQSIGDSGKIYVSIHETDSNVVIDFQDSGPGIPSKNLSEIFEPLFTTKQHGTGLGLVSCKNIVKQHGGKISVKNNPTTFSVTLPKFPDKEKITSLILNN